MDRKRLIDLFRKGMEYPPGRHRFWISRCFEITVRADDVVELDEYESFASEQARNPEEALCEGPQAGNPGEMFHVGRSVLRLKDGEIEEEPGRGWSGRR